MKDEKKVLAGNINAGIKMVCAGVLTYVCSSPRMKRNYRLRLREFGKEIQIAVGLRKHTPELENEFSTAREVSDLIESLEADCRYKNDLKWSILIDGHSVKYDKELARINESIAAKKDMLKMFEKQLKLDTSLAREAHKTHKKEMRAQRKNS